MSISFCLDLFQFSLMFRLMFACTHHNQYGMLCNKQVILSAACMYVPIIFIWKLLEIFMPPLFTIYLIWQFRIIKQAICFRTECTWIYSSIHHAKRDHKFNKGNFELIYSRPSSRQSDAHVDISIKFIRVRIINYQVSNFSSKKKLSNFYTAETRVTTSFTRVQVKKQILSMNHRSLHCSFVRTTSCQKLCQCCIFKIQIVGHGWDVQRHYSARCIGT